MRKREELEREARLNSRSMERTTLEVLLDVRDLLIKASKTKRKTKKESV